MVICDCGIEKNRRKKEEKQWRIACAMILFRRPDTLSPAKLRHLRRAYLETIQQQQRTLGKRKEI
jgi:hypothetical protein